MGKKKSWKVWKSMFLFLNTIQGYDLELGLFDEQEWRGRVKVRFLAGHGDKTLVLLEKTLKRSKVKLGDLQGIAVLQGSGSFTGIRIGLTIANIIGFVLNIPVLAVKSLDQDSFRKTIKRLSKMKKPTPIKPFYDREPNIT